MNREPTWAKPTTLAKVDSQQGLTYVPASSVNHLQLFTVVLAPIISRTFIKIYGAENNLLKTGNMRQAHCGPRASEHRASL